MGWQGRPHRRADSENRIKELKEDLSLDTFCLQSFDATDAAFRTGCMLSNLLMGYRETVLPSRWVERRLRAGRDLVFLVGADLIPAPGGSGCASPSPVKSGRSFCSACAPSRRVSRLRRRWSGT
ncbi:MAG: hypothetical protein ACREJU_11080 [Nitrospiraceae bacterium]